MTDNNRNIIKGFGFTIFGIAAGLASILGLPDSKGNLKLILLIIAIVSILVSVWFFLSARIRFTTAINLLIRSKELGIYKIHLTGKSDETLTSKMRNSKVIKIFFTTGIAFFRIKEDDLIKAFENNANVLILLAHPDSDFTRDIEIMIYRNGGEISHEIAQVKIILNRCLNEAKKNTNNQSIGKYTIKYFKSQLRFPMVICDDEYGWITLTLPPARSVQSASIEAIKSKNGLLNKCIRHFDEVWASISNEPESLFDNSNLISFLIGDWKNEWEINTKTGIEILKITKDYYYFANGEHLFNIERLQYDKENGNLIFIKSGVKPNDNRRLLNVVRIVNNNKLEGTEDNYVIRYYRL